MIRLPHTCSAPVGTVVGVPLAVVVLGLAVYFLLGGVAEAIAAVEMQERSGEAWTVVGAVAATLAMVAGVGWRLPLRYVFTREGIETVGLFGRRQYPGNGLREIVRTEDGRRIVRLELEFADGRTLSLNATNIDASLDELLPVLRRTYLRHLLPLFLQQSRGQLTAAQRSEPGTGIAEGEQVPEPLEKHYAELIAAGTVVWGNIVQAHRHLFDRAECDCDHYARVVYSPDPHFDARPHHLRDIAQRVFALKATLPRDPELRPVAAAMTNEVLRVERMELPERLSDGHGVYMATCQVHRSRLPTRVLGDGLLPLVVRPEGGTVANMILPLKYWAPGLQGWWGEISSLLPQPRKGPPVEVEARRPEPEPPSHAEPVRVTRGMAEWMLEGDEKLHLIKVDAEWLGWGYAYSVSYPDAWDPADEVCFEMHGVKVVVDVGLAPLIGGLVVDLQRSIFGKGYLFHPVHDPWAAPSGGSGKRIGKR